jgi:hypothetical protein
MQVLQHAFRLYVAHDKFEQAIAFYERIQGVRYERRVNIPETGINAAKIGGFLIFTGASRACRASEKSTRSSMLIPSTRPFRGSPKTEPRFLPAHAMLQAEKTRPYDTRTASSSNISRRRGETGSPTDAAAPAASSHLAPRRLRRIAELKVDRTDAADGDDRRLVLATDHAVIMRRQGDAMHVAAS